MNFKIKQRVDLYNLINEVQYTDCEIIGIVPAKQRPSEKVQALMLTENIRDGKIVRTRCSTMAHSVPRYLVRVSPTLVHLVTAHHISPDTMYRAPFPKSFLDLVALEKGFADWERAKATLETLPYFNLIRSADRAAKRTRYRKGDITLTKKTGESVEDFQKRILNALNIIWLNEAQPSKSDIEKLKKFISKQPDRLRSAYSVHKNYISLNTVPGQIVLMETTNEPDYKITTEDLDGNYSVKIEKQLQAKTLDQFRAEGFQRTRTAEVMQWFFKQGTRRHLIVANRLKTIIGEESRFRVDRA